MLEKANARQAYDLVMNWCGSLIDTMRFSPKGEGKATSDQRDTIESYPKESLAGEADLHAPCQGTTQEHVQVVGRSHRALAPRDDTTQHTTSKRSAALIPHHEEPNKRLLFAVLLCFPSHLQRPSP